MNQTELRLSDLLKDDHLIKMLNELGENSNLDTNTKLLETISNFVFQKFGDFDLTDSFFKLLFECHPTLLDNISYIPDSLFYSSNLKTIGLPNPLKLSENITGIEEDAFNGSTIESVFISKNIEYIGESAFAFCNNLKNVVFAENGELREIKDNAFSCCHNLESITLPSNLKELHSWTFHFCEKLKYVSIPGELAEIGDSVFDHCNKLKSLEVRGIKDDVWRLSPDLEQFKRFTSIEVIHCDDGDIEL